MEAEKAAYERAQEFDAGTILRQNQQLSELIKDIEALREKNRTLRVENDALEEKVDELQDKLNGR